MLQNLSHQFDSFNFCSNRGALIPTGTDSEEEIDISQMTWEEKETVLQHLLLNLDVFRRRAQNHHPDVKTTIRKTQQLINVETRYIKPFMQSPHFIF